MKVEEQSVELEAAKSAVRSAQLELDTLKTEHQLKLEELRTVQLQLADREANPQDKDAQEKIRALTASVEEQSAELECALARLTEREVELAKVNEELSSCSQNMAL